jgi:FMN reductase
VSRNIVVVVGNPKENSRTRQASEMLANALTGKEPRTVIELAPLGAELLTWGAPKVSEAKEVAAKADLLIVASPTFKAGYTALLKLFLEQYNAGTGLAGAVAVPLMLGGGEQHSLAVQHTLTPTITEIGALALPGLFLVDATFHEDGVIDAYAERWRDSVDRLTVR